MLGRSLREDVGEEFEGGWWGRSLRVCGGEEFEGPSEYCGSRDHTLGVQEVPQCAYGKTTLTC